MPTSTVNPKINKFVPEKHQEQMLASIEERKNDAERYRKEKEPDMAKMLMADAKDLKAILALCKKGKWKEACNTAYAMDTAVRECIPESLWNLMHTQAEMWRSF